MSNQSGHTTNYQNAFISVSEDSKATRSVPPPQKKDKPTVAELQHALLTAQPYQYTSDDVLFLVHALKNNLPEEAYPSARAAFFSKGQACLRTSPLVKTYGFGLHCEAQGRVALVGMDTPVYQQFQQDESLKQLKGMRSSRK